MLDLQRFLLSTLLQRILTKEYIATLWWRTSLTCETCLAPSESVEGWQTWSTDRPGTHTDTVLRATSTECYRERCRCNPTSNLWRLNVPFIVILNALVIHGVERTGNSYIYFNYNNISIFWMGDAVCIGDGSRSAVGSTLCTLYRCIGGVLAAVPACSQTPARSRLRPQRAHIAGGLPQQRRQGSHVMPTDRRRTPTQCYDDLRRGCSGTLQFAQLVHS